MTRPIKLSFGNEVSETAISNIFIDEYMAEANGAYVKVYIYLLRCLGDSAMSISVASISEKLDETEKDIIKALRYWEKQKLLYIMWDGEGQISSITLNPLTGNTVSHRPDNIIRLSVADDIQSQEETPAPAVRKAPAKTVAAPDRETVEVSRPDYSARQIAKFKQHDDFNRLIDFIEERLGRTMTMADLQSPAFMYEQLEMPADLIRFLYDYCISKGKTAPAYIEKIAMAWHEKEINDVESARSEVFSRSKECKAIKAAFGITRPLGAIEYEYIDRWRFTYGMSDEMITAACDRALLNTSNPDFKYADRILEGWHKKGITDAEGIAAEDAAHAARVQRTQKAPSRTAATPNKFNDYSQRSYSSKDYEDLERRKMGKL